MPPINPQVISLGSVPIGCCLPWLKSFTNVPALPPNWVECNGQSLSDAASVFNGQTIPNLNGSSSTKRFLRGSTTSGGTGGADTVTPAGTVGAPVGTFSATGGLSAVASSAHSHTFTGTNASYLPSYYEVVYVMRVR